MGQVDVNVSYSHRKDNGDFCPWLHVVYYKHCGSDWVNCGCEYGLIAVASMV